MLVTTVGPFARWGVPAAAAATTAGRPLHRLDRRAALHPRGLRALRAGRRARPASGCSPRSATTGCRATSPAALALERAGELATRVDVGYFITGQRRFDERRHEGIARRARSPTPAFGLPRRPRPDRARRQAGAHLPGRFEGAVRRVSVGSSEHFALPRVAPQLREVNAYLGWFGPASRAMQVMSACTSVAHEGAGRGEALERGGRALRQGLHRRPGRGGALEDAAPTSWRSPTTRPGAR